MNVELLNLDRLISDNAMFCGKKYNGNYLKVMLYKEDVMCYIIKFCQESDQKSIGLWLESKEKQEIRETLEQFENLKSH